MDLYDLVCEIYPFMTYVFSMLKMWRAFNGSPGSLKCIFVHGAFVRICSVFFFFKGDTFEMSSPKWLFTARFFGRFGEENPPLRVQYAERTR